MSKTQIKYKNNILVYRERLGLTQEQLAHMIRCRRPQTIRRIERGTTVPGLTRALRLSAALRVPVEFLYQPTYIHLRDEVRAAEEGMESGMSQIR